MCDLGSGDLFGEVSLFNAVPRTASVTALGEGALLEIDCPSLVEYMDEHPDTGYAIMKAAFQVLVDRFTMANKRVEYFFAWGLKSHGIDKDLDAGTRAGI